jgi:hypothetical protein
MKFIQLISLLLLTGFQASAQNNSSELLNRFKQYITGDFDNANQVVEELKTGKVIHPLAIHVNRVVDSKVTNKPANFAGFFLLEESYYLAEGKPTEAKPYLFLFSLVNNDVIHLTTYQLTGYEKEALRNDNPTLQFNYDSLVPSPTFRGADYSWNAKEKTFSTVSVNELGNQMRFTLSETFSAKTLWVMELLEKDGKSLTAYSTPIRYERKQ